MKEEREGFPKRNMPSIKADICASFGVSEEELSGKSRRKSIVMARKMFAALAYTEAGASLHEIGQVLGDRDHTTIKYYIDSVKAITLRNSA